MMPMAGREVEQVEQPRVETQSGKTLVCIDKLVPDTQLHKLKPGDAKATKAESGVGLYAVLMGVLIIGVDKGSSMFWISDSESGSILC